MVNTTYKLDINFNYINEEVTKGNITEKNASQLINYATQKLINPNDKIHKSYFDYFLLKASLEYGILGIFIYEETEERFLYNYTILDDTILSSLLPFIKIKNTYQSLLFNFNNQNYSLWIKKYHTDDKKYTILSIFPEKIDIVPAIIKLKYVFIHQFIIDLKIADLRFSKIYTILDKYITNSINYGFDSGKSIVLTYIKSESLQNYVKIGGEYFIHEVFKNIQKIIRDHLRNDEELYILTPHDFLVVGISSEINNENDIKTRFKNVYFEYIGLYFKYKLKSEVVTQKIESLAHIWDKIHIPSL